MPIPSTPTPTRLPTPFESLAGVAKFLGTEEMSPAFHARHAQPIDAACAFLHELVREHPSLDMAFNAALPLPVADGGHLVLQALSSIQFAEQKLHWFDSQMNTTLRALAPVVRDPALPTWMAECRWAVDGAAVNV
ncbi:hypothetical protein [Acidovorax sp.]|uniref:hypothetical protein n=1 Tax=Acidovorax sp. TaxID=1872122 RepID=UPI002ACE54D7|nr:hypothetical protein [Acidovorax sp.]MDZ7863194.1 hypothetical protein [Acidovorax sp.]